MHYLWTNTWKGVRAIVTTDSYPEIIRKCASTDGRILKELSDFKDQGNSIIKLTEQMMKNNFITQKEILLHNTIYENRVMS